MRPLVLLIVMLLIPQATALMATPDRERVDIEVGTSATVTVHVEDHTATAFTLAIDGRFGYAERIDNATVRIVLSPGDVSGSADLGTFALSNSTALLIRLDATDWTPRGRTDEERPLNLTLDAMTAGTVRTNITVRAYHDWETDVNGQKFILAMFPLIAIFVGIAFLRRDGMTMSVVGWFLAALLAVGYFHTTPEVVAGATAVGIIKAFGISIAVLFTMLMIFIMKEVGSLDVISGLIKRAVRTKEEQALFIGIGFGSFLTSLGVTTPAMFPPLLVAMGFSPFAAVMIAVLGYNATTSFALLSIPITIPAEVGGLDAELLAWKISLFLPVLSVGLSFAMLWFIGGRRSVRKGVVPALLAGLSIAISCLAFTWSALHPLEIGGASIYVPLRVVGVLAGLIAMAVLYTYHRWRFGGPKEVAKVDRRAAFVALFPWILLTGLAAITSLEACQSVLEDSLGGAEVITVFADQRLDLNVLSQIYTWILVATIASLPVLRPTRSQLRRAAMLWLRRSWRPFVAFSMYFAIAYIMFFSGKEVVSGHLLNSPDYAQFNMNLILGTSLAVAFGSGFVYVAGSLGVFGAFVGGSETASNVMFLGVQRSATSQTRTDFMTAFGAHAAAGGIASAITPAKITNAVALIGEDRALEARVIRSNTIFVLLSSIAIGLMTALFITLNL